MAAQALDASLAALLDAAELAASPGEAARATHAALEALDARIRALGVGGAAQAALIGRFKALLDQAEALGPLTGGAAQPEQLYGWHRAQARRLAEAAVAADGAGQAEQAAQLYRRLLEVLNACYKAEPDPRGQAAIMGRFQVYLERAEQLQSRELG